MLFFSTMIIYTVRRSSRSYQYFFLENVGNVQSLGMSCCCMFSTTVFDCFLNTVMEISKLSIGNQR